MEHNQNIHYIYLPIKGHWLEMIKSGIKHEEYREMSKCNMRQFDKVNRIIASSFDKVVIRFHQYRGIYHEATIKSVRIGQGNPALGAPSGKDVIIYQLD